jgi:peptidylprolyl isomerase
MLAIQNGCLVRLDYTLSTEDLLIDSTEGTQPLEFVVGSGALHPAIEMLLMGLSKGDKIEKWIDAGMAFGDYDPQWRIRIARKKLPSKVQHFKEGMSFETLGPDNKKRLFRIVEANDDFVIMDGNHPLAGENLFLQAHVLDVQMPS